MHDSKAIPLRSDQSILKFSTKPGEKAHSIPLKGSTVWFHLEGRKPNGELLDKSKARYEKKIKTFFR